MRVVQKPETFDAIELTSSTSSADLQAFYDEVKPDGSAEVTVTKIGQQLLVSTTDAAEWIGQFAAGDMVAFNDPIFTLLGPANDYAPYDEIYGSHS